MVKLHTPIGNSNKLSLKFTGPYKVIASDSRNKFKVQHLETGDISVRHADELKQTHMNEFNENTLIDNEEAGKTETNTETETKTNTETVTNHVETGTDSAQTGTSHTAADNENHAYKIKLRSHRQQVLPLTCINEPSLENEFYDVVDEMLDELNIDCYSFYR